METKKMVTRRYIELENGEEYTTSRHGDVVPAGKNFWIIKNEEIEIRIPYGIDGHAGKANRAVQYAMGK